MQDNLHKFHVPFMVSPMTQNTRKTAAAIASRKGRAPVACLTAYTTPMARLLDPHVDMLLVGDSVSMVLYGMDNTRGADLPMMIRHGQAVMRGSEQACVIVDMPFGSYEDSDDLALQNAREIMDKTGCHGVKLEGGAQMASRVQTLTAAGLPVMGHIGLLPQSVETPDGYRVQGKDENSARQILEDARALAEAGVFSIVLEAVPESLAAEITQAVPVPTIGIGASAACDGQVLVSEDMLGLTRGKKPRFVKEYAHIADDIERAASTYAKEVRERQFPASGHTYNTKIKAA